MTRRVGEPRLFAEPAPARAPTIATTFADVVFDRPIDQVYTYAVPASLIVKPGVRVSLPFGRGDKLDTGYVVNVHNVKPPREVKSIVRVLDSTPLITDELLKLTRWVADYYLCGWGQALQAVLPAGVRDQAGTRNITFVEAIPTEQLPDSLPELTPKQAVVLEHARRIGGPVEQAHLARAAKSTSAIIGLLVEKGYLNRDKRRVERDAAPDNHAMTEEATKPITLNAEQQSAWAQIEVALSSGGFHPFLVHGVTGSGKTELYLRAIEEVIRHGKQAVVLVPEISLTPQTIARFKGRCGQVAVLHSNLGDAERGTQWRAVASGQVQVIVGARSAVFAPCPRLGLVVVDEEHENTFKQETTPRYHGRDVAVMRARLEGVPVLLGSATPSLESWHNAQKGHYSLLSLPNRVLDRPLPPVHLIDLRHERPVGAISPPLDKAMRQALADGGQVMLLLNRRGFNTTVHCPSCGYVAPCDYCDISLTFHRQRQALVCHYCGFEKAPLTTCPTCQRDAMKYFGLGTEKLHNELAERFPGYEIRRMDSDTMSKPGSHAKVLDEFRAGKVHVLMGTQMIAKGFDFPNVTLVGVVNADIALHVPDFRAGERTFQLLAQVAGRTGRGPRGGKVLIQTYAPEHPGISYAVKHDYLGFVSQEMPQRELHQYPPYQRLARLIIRSEKHDQAAEFAERLAGAFRIGEQPGVRVLGPAECPVHKLNGFFRFHFQLQSTGSTAMHHVLKSVLATVRPPGGVEFQTDVDAYSMM